MTILSEQLEAIFLEIKTNFGQHRQIQVLPLGGSPYEGSAKKLGLRSKPALIISFSSISPLDFLTSPPTASRKLLFSILISTRQPSASVTSGKATNLCPI